MPRCGSCLSRRTFLTAAGALTLGALPGCTVYGSSANSPAAPVAQSGTKLATTSEIPVGGGKIFVAAQVVVTQPKKGTFKAFSGLCTHLQCLVDKVEAGVIQCPCHGSRFSLDGSVVHGPAAEPLHPVTITISGEDITLQ
jgi:Rieske Fe-S protein